MKNGLPAISLSQQAKQYCLAHASDFERDLREQALEIIRNKPYLTFLAITVAACANIPYAGVLSFAYLAPALTLCVVGAVLSRASRTRVWMTDHAPLFFDAILLLAVVGLSFLWMKILRDGVRPQDNPVQFTLAVVCIFAHRSQYWKMVLRNALFATAMATVFFVLSRDFFNESVGYFIGGGGHWQLAHASGIQCPPHSLLQRQYSSQSEHAPAQRVGFHGVRAPKAYAGESPAVGKNHGASTPNRLFG